MLSNVGDPQAVRGVRGKAALYQVAVARTSGITPRAAPLAPAMYTYQPRFAHQASDAFTRAANLVLAVQLGMDTRRTIDATALGMDSLNPFCQFDICLGAS